MKHHVSPTVPFHVTFCLVFAIAQHTVTANAQHPIPTTALTPLPTGLTLPITLSPGTRAGATKPGSPITGVTTQRIFITPNTYINQGAHLSGIVVTSTAATSNPPQSAILVLRFQTLTYAHQQVPSPSPHSRSPISLMSTTLKHPPTAAPTGAIRTPPTGPPGRSVGTKSFAPAGSATSSTPPCTT